MELPLTGGCQCGKIRYEITQAPQLVYTCHCTDCQRITGSAFSLGIVLPETAFHRTAGEPRALQRMPDSGRLNTRFVCPECACWVYNLPARRGNPPPCRDAGRHILAAAHPAYLDPQQAALGHFWRRR